MQGVYDFGNPFEGVSQGLQQTQQTLLSLDQLRRQRAQDALAAEEHGANMGLLSLKRQAAQTELDQAQGERAAYGAYSQSPVADPIARRRKIAELMTKYNRADLAQKFSDEADALQKAEDQKRAGLRWAQTQATGGDLSPTRENMAKADEATGLVQSLGMKEALPYMIEKKGDEARNEAMRYGIEQRLKGLEATNTSRERTAGEANASRENIAAAHEATLRDLAAMKDALERAGQTVTKNGAGELVIVPKVAQPVTPPATPAQTPSPAPTVAPAAPGVPEHTGGREGQARAGMAAQATSQPQPAPTVPGVVNLGGAKPVKPTQRRTQVQNLDDGKWLVDLDTGDKIKRIGAAPPTGGKNGPMGLGGGVMTPAAEKMAAEAAALGIKIELPALGMASGARVGVMNSIAEYLQANNLPVSSLGDNAAMRKALTYSMQNMKKNADMTKQAVMQADNNGRALQEASRNFNRSEYPLPNKIQTWLGTQAGTPQQQKEIAQFKVGLLAFSREYMRVVTGAARSVAELSMKAQDTADDVMSRFDSWSTLNAKIEQARKEMAGVSKSHADVANEIKDSLSKIGKAGGGADGGGDVKPTYADFKGAYDGIVQKFKGNPAERDRRLKALVGRARADGVVK